MSDSRFAATGTRKRTEVPIDQILEAIKRVRYAEWNGSRIRYVVEGNSAWFVLRDVLEALDYRVKASHVKKRTSPNECLLMEIGAKSALANCVNMTGLVKILSFSGKPDAPDFLEWAREVERGVKL